MRRLTAHDLAWLAAVPAAVLVAAALLWLAPPLSGLIYPKPGRFFVVDPGIAARPEPHEGTRFLLAAAAPFLFAGLILFLSLRGRIGRDDDRPGWADRAIIGVQLLLVAFAVVSIAAQFGQPIAVPANAGFAHSVIPLWGLLFGLVAGATATALAIRRRCGGQRAGPRVVDRGPVPTCDPARRKPLLDPVLAAMAVVTALWLLPAIFTEANISHSRGLVPFHTPVQFDEYLAALNGRTPLVDFISQYCSLLPLALEPVLSVFGSSITTFTISATGLSLVAFLAVYLTFREVTRSRAAAAALYIPYLAIALLPYREQGAQRNFVANLYSTMPGRYLGPLVVGWLCARSIRRHGQRTWLIFFVAGLAVLNNFEFGFPCLLAAAVAVALGTDRGIPAVARRRLAVEAWAGLLGSLALVSAVTLLRSGELPHLRFLVYFGRLFAMQGFGLLPSPVLGLHVVMLLTYAAALATGAVRYVGRAENRTLTGLLGYSGAFGLGTISYFGGRSVSLNLVSLFAAWGLAAALLAWTAWRSVTAGQRARTILVPALAIFSALGAMASTVVRFPAPWTQVERIGQGGPDAYDRPAAVRYIAANTTPGEPVSIFVKLAHRTADRAGVVDTMPFNSSVNVVTNSMMDQVVQSLGQAGGSQLFLGQSTYPEIQAYLAAHGYARVGADTASGLIRWRLMSR